MLRLTFLFAVLSAYPMMASNHTPTADNHHCTQCNSSSSNSGHNHSGTADPSSKDHCTCPADCACHTGAPCDCGCKCGGSSHEE